MKEWAKKAFGEELGSGAFTLVNGELLNALRTLVDFQDIAESVTNVVFGNNVMWGWKIDCELKEVLRNINHDAGNNY